MQSKSRRFWGIIFVLPQLIGLIIFSLIPIIRAIEISFYDWDGISEHRTFVFLSNYISEFKSADFMTGLKNTFMYMFYYIPPAIIMALIVALALVNIRGKTVYRVLFFMPVVAGSVSIGVIWTWLLNGDFGLINQMLALVGIQGPGWLTEKRWVLPSIAMMSVWWNLGYNMIIFLAGLQNVPKTYYEAAEIDGASKLRTFFSVTLPMISPTILFVTIMTVISSFQVFDQAMVMTEGGPAKASYTFVYHIYTRAFKEFTMGKASASAIVLFLIILAVTGIEMYTSKRWVNYDQ